MTESAVPHQGPGPSFRLDVGLARQAVTELEGARRQLRVVHARAVELSRAAGSDMSASDRVSLDALGLLGLAADGGPSSLTAALDVAITHVQSLIDQMNADVDEQERIDRDSASALRST